MADPWLSAALTLAIGWSFLASGLIVWAREKENPLGALMAAVVVLLVFRLFVVVLPESAPLVWAFGALGVGHVVLSTSGDWLRTLATFLRTRSRRR